MRIETYGQQIEVTPALREYVETKFKRLERHFEQPLEVRTQLGIRKPDYIAEATLNLDRRPGRQAGPAAAQAQAEENRRAARATRRECRLTACRSTG